MRCYILTSFCLMLSLSIQRHTCNRKVLSLRREEEGAGEEGSMAGKPELYTHTNSIKGSGDVLQKLVFSKNFPMWFNSAFGIENHCLRHALTTFNVHFPVMRAGEPGHISLVLKTQQLCCLQQNFSKHVLGQLASESLGYLLLIHVPRLAPR